MGVEPRLATVLLPTYLRGLEAEAAIEARGKNINIVTPVPENLAIEADPRLLRSAVTNLLQNELKFSHEQSTVTVKADRSEGRITIEVADGCGGLPPGKAELFASLVQRRDNRTGFGLGLGIALQAAETHNGTIKAKDTPGTGCAFIIDLPSTSPTSTSTA